MQNSAGKHVLAKVRAEAELTQGELAALLHCHKMTIQRIEQGLLELSVSLAERIQEVLGVSASWLLTNNFEITEVTPEGRPWYKSDFEMAQVRATAWGKVALPPSGSEVPNQLATLTEQLKRWRFQRLATYMDASASLAQKTSRFNEFGLLLNRLEKAVYDVIANFGIDPEVLKAGEPKIAELREAYQRTLAATQEPRDSLPPTLPRKRRYKRRGGTPLG